MDSKREGSNKMKVLCIILVLIGSSLAVHLLKVKSELNNEMFNYLHKFGYLPKQITNSKNVTATKEFKNGILLLQVIKTLNDLMCIIC